MATQPARGLGVLDASLLVVGSIVGAGIFLVSPFVAESVRSPAAFLGVWLLGGLAALAGALSNGELGGLFPRSGGEYVYLREAYGPAFGFLSGWTAFWIAFPGSIAALAGGFGSTVAALLGLPGGRAPLVIGVLAIAVLTVVNVVGLEAGKWLQNGLSSTKLAAFVLLLTLGFGAARGTSPASAPMFAPGDHPSGIASALVPVMFAYSGWNAAAYVTGEMRDPRRGLGRALGLGTALCIALYLAVNLAYLRAIPLSELSSVHDPAHETALRLGGTAAAGLLSPLVAICVLSSLQATVLVGPRVYHAMAIDGLFLAPFGRLHKRLRTPVNALVAQAFISAVQLVSGTFDQLLTFATFAILAFSTLTVAAVIVLRVRRPELERTFPVPGYPLLPALFVCVNLWVLWSVVSQGALAALVGVAIVATGVPAYFAFRARMDLKEMVP